MNNANILNWSKGSQLIRDSIDPDAWSTTDMNSFLGVAPGSTIWLAKRSQIPEVRHSQQVFRFNLDRDHWVTHTSGFSPFFVTNRAVPLLLDDFAWRSLKKHGEQEG